MSNILKANNVVDLASPSINAKNLKSPHRAENQKTSVICIRYRERKRELQLDSLKDTREWTGIAPNGRFLTPTVIPTPNCLDTKEINKSTSSLKDHQTAQKLADECQKKSYDCQHIYSIYQSDYRNHELPKHLCAKNYNLEPDVKNRGLIDLDCSAQKKMNDIKIGQKHCDKCNAFYQPIEVNFADAPFTCGKTEVFWTPKPYHKIPTTEYRDVISRVGCIIERNHLHNHTKCKAQRCAHMRGRCMKDF